MKYTVEMVKEDAESLIKNYGKHQALIHAHERLQRLGGSVNGDMWTKILHYLETH